jgi:hypothetical protein
MIKQLYNVLVVFVGIFVLTFVTALPFLAAIKFAMEVVGW